MKKKLTLLLACFFMIGLVTAQTQEVRGIVISEEDGQPVIGAAVSVTGTTLGVITDVDGKFVLSNIPGSAKTLQVSLIGMQTQQVTIQPNLRIVLKPDEYQFEDVIITVPYGVAKKSTFTGSASVIDSKVISASQVSSVSKALQGSVAGLQSFSTSGQPGEDASIYIRGIGSINASTTPLYVVDGVPYDGALSSISSQDISSITVLKDAAAATLYGSRAANGVIMITTKQGANDSPVSIELSAKYGFSSRAVSDYKQPNTRDYFMLQWEGIRNSYLDKKYSAADAAQRASSELMDYIGINPYGSEYPQPIGTDGRLVSGAKLLWNDNWEDALTQNAHYTDLSARISGGSKSTKYYFSLGYLDDQGAYICSGFKRYTLRTNITSDLRKWLQVGLNVSGTHSEQNYPKQDDTALGNIVLAARSIPSFYPVYQRNLDTGEYLRDEDGDRIYDYGTYRKSSYNGYNFAQSMYYDKNDIKRDAASVRGYLLVSPLDGLNYKMSINVDYNSKFTHNFTNPTYGKQPVTGSVSKRNDRTTGVTFNNVINWERTFNSLHSTRLMAGQEYYEFNTSNFVGSRSGSISDGYYEPNAAPTLTGFEGYSDQYKLLSFFGSAEYSYNQRYFVSASVRSDGSSRFHPDKRWGTFWSFGGSWKINQEQFLENAQGWLSNLGLRASYGAQGNDNVGYYAYPELYSINSFLGESALLTSRLATPDLTWETNLTLNVGLDFGFFNNRLNGSIEYFDRASKNLLFSRELVASSGFRTLDENIGKLKNYGWEFTVNGTPVYTKDWNWRLSVNATTYKNKIVKLPSEEMWQSTKKWVKDGSMYDFWLYEWAGVNPENGNPQWYYYDKDGNKQVTEDYSSLQAKDKVKMGSSLPKLSGGFQSDLTWRDLTLSVLFSYGIGGKIFNNDKRGMMGVTGNNGNTISKDLLDRWTPENTNASVPRLVQDGTSYFTSSSSYWLVDRSFLRLKTLTLNYNLPKKWISPATLKDVSVFMQGENILTFSKQQGLDPEQPINGMASYRYPAMKTISFGINVKL
ncbi:MAG: TonB-dependent receptor [Dysgonomonas sp.]|nr:TonB-dependent receptor [Dysgonomonas sp.]